jgi:hypothetical protein
MNWKKFFIAFIAAFVFMFVFGYIWYGNLMHNIHQEVPALWRTEPTFPWLIFGHVVMAFFLTCIYARFVSAGGPGAGAKLGIKIALVFIGNDLILYAVQPLTTKILCGWIFGDLIMFAIAGAIIGAIYKPAIVSTTLPVT